MSLVKAWKHAFLFVSFGDGGDDDDDCGGGDDDDDGDDGGDGVTCAVLVTSGERSDGGGGVSVCRAVVRVLGSGVGIVIANRSTELC